MIDIIQNRKPKYYSLIHQNKMDIGKYYDFLDLTIDEHCDIQYILISIHIELQKLFNKDLETKDLLRIAIDIEELLICILKLNDGKFDILIYKEIEKSLNTYFNIALEEELYEILTNISKLKKCF
jgi:hypothetical protein